jgi:hypothetical protein
MVWNKYKEKAMIMRKDTIKPNEKKNSYALHRAKETIQKLMKSG